MSLPGIVVSVRVNPADVMSVMDAIDYLGIPRVNLSFAQMAKLVLSSALESYRQSGIVPRRTGFEYLNMVASLDRGNFSSRGKKLQTAQLLRQPSSNVDPIVPESHERRARRIIYEELMIRKQADPINWTDADQQAFIPLAEEFYPV